MMSKDFPYSFIGIRLRNSVASEKFVASKETKD